MAPKRKAEELANAVNAMQSAASKQTVVDEKASGAAVTCCRLHSQHRPSLELMCAVAGTLAGASGQSVDTLLDRIGNRRQRALAAKVQTIVPLASVRCHYVLSQRRSLLTERSMTASYGSSALPYCCAPDLLVTSCQGRCSMLHVIAVY